MLVLFQLVAHERPGRETVRSVGEPLGLAPSVVQKSLARLQAAQLLDPARRPLLGNAEEFLFHAVRYVFPASLGGPARGVPTAWAASVLDLGLSHRQDDVPVWPDPQGTERGLAIKPLSPRVPELARNDQRLYELLALVDCLRIGDARVRRAAGEQLKRHLREAHDRAA